MSDKVTLDTVNGSVDFYNPSDEKIASIGYDVEADKFISKNLHVKIDVKNPSFIIKSLPNTLATINILYNDKIYMTSTDTSIMNIFDTETMVTTTASVLSEGYKYTAQVYKNKMYIPSQDGTAIDVYDFDTGNVSVITGLPSIAVCRTSQVHNGKLYLISSIASQSMTVYDLELETFTSVSGFYHSHNVVIVYNEKMYMPDYYGYGMDVYDLATTAITDVNTQYYQHSNFLFIYNDKLYIFDDTNILKTYDFTTGDEEFLQKGFYSGVHSGVIYNNIAYLPKYTGGFMNIYDLTTQTNVVIPFPSDYCQGSILHKGKLYIPSSDSCMIIYDLKGTYELGAGFTELGSDSFGLYGRLSDGTTFREGAGIIDFKETAQGTYIKYANGVLVQHGVLSELGTTYEWSINNHNIGTYGWSYASTSSTNLPEVTLPVPFIDNQYTVTVTPSSNVRMAQVSTREVDSFKIVYHSYNLISSTTTCHWIAIGKWKL